MLSLIYFFIIFVCLHFCIITIKLDNIDVKKLVWKKNDIKIILLLKKWKLILLSTCVFSKEAANRCKQYNGESTALQKEVPD
jgi:hypothetical protein